MSVTTRIVDGPIGPPPPSPHPPDARGVGAVLVFDGVVRAMEDGRELRALAYEAYEPMASHELMRLARETVERHKLIGLECWHSRGEVPVGAASLRVVIWSAHRAEALAGMGAFIDALKRDVPIWKRPVWRDG